MPPRRAPSQASAPSRAASPVQEEDDVSTRLLFWIAWTRLRRLPSSILSTNFNNKLIQSIVAVFASANTF